MANPTFSFELGKPANNQGRWVEGRVLGDKDGYNIEVDLFFSRQAEGGGLQMNRLDLRVDRDFSPSEFATIVLPARIGHFAVATSMVRVTDDGNADRSVEEIQIALSADDDLSTETTGNSAQYVTAFREKLDTLRKRELLRRAFMRFGSSPGTHVVFGDPDGTVANSEQQ